MLNLKVLVCGLAVSSMSVAALAQSSTGGKDQPASKQPEGQRGRGGAAGGPGGGMMGEQLSPEKAKAAWDLEATNVATRLKLTADQTKSLVTAYETARTSAQAANEKVRKEQMDKMRDAEDRQAARQDMMKAIEAVNKSEREKFTKAVTAAIPGDSGTKAAAALGVFNPQWDRMVDVVSGFKLDGTKQQNVLNTIEDHIATQAKNMAGGANQDPQDRREAMQAAREKLTAALKKDLTDDQMKKFDEATAPGRGMGGGRGRGQRGGDGGSDK